MPIDIVELNTPKQFAEEVSSLEDKWQARHTRFTRGYRHVAIRRGMGLPPVIVVINPSDRGVTNAVGVNFDPELGTLVRDFAAREGLDIKVRLTEIGFLQSADGGLHRLDQLPDNLAVDGDLVFSPRQSVRWPRRLLVTGDFTAPGLVGPFCDDLEVTGRVSIMGARIRRLPAKTIIGGNLFAPSSEIEELHPEVRIGGNIFLSDSRLARLPDRLSVKGTLHVSRTKLRELPPGLSVEDALSCRGNAILCLPADISVKGPIWLAGSDIVELPEQLTCGGLDISRTRVRSIPPGTHLTGPLEASWSSLERIGERCFIEGNLEAQHSKLRSVPSDVSVGGSVDLSGTAVEELPDGLSIPGDLLLPHTPISSVPDVLDVGGKLDLRHTRIRRADVPDTINVGGIIYVTAILPKRKAMGGMLMSFLARLGGKSLAGSR
jgi:hypothetical protein|nr:hypothetical protein [Neorhizobium tomejilense]